MDILVNNAGIVSMAPIDVFSLNEFDRTFAVNVCAVFVATQATVKRPSFYCFLSLVMRAGVDGFDLPGSDCSNFGAGSAFVARRGSRGRAGGGRRT